MMHRTRRLFIVLVLVASCASSPPVVKRVEEIKGEQPVAVHVVGHGWHTGIVVPAGDIQARLPALRERFGDVPRIEFGWGDKAFYQADEITAGMAIKASLWPTAAVMHAVAVPADVAAYFPRSEVHRLCLTPGGYDALLHFIVGSFRRAEDGELAPLGRGRYGDSQFYEAVGSYTLFNTCNTWTARALKSAGLDIDPTSKATASSVMDYLREAGPAAAGACEPAD